MSYAAPFHRLVMIGNLYADTFNTSLSIVPGLSGTMPAVTDALLEDVADVIGTWWPKIHSSTYGGGLSIAGGAQLTSIKLNRIDTTGHYQDDETKEWVYPAPIPGGNTVNTSPPQCTLVATLRGGAERAHAGKGRMYPPPTLSSGSVDSSGRISVGAATNYAYGVVTLIQALNDCYLAASVNAVVGIASQVGTGAFQAVEKVTVGRVIDTMRSRRNKLAEDPFELSVT